MDRQTRDLWLSYGPGAVVARFGAAAALDLAGPAPAAPAMPAEPYLTLPDVVTIAGYGLGLYWSLGGPAWAGVASIVADEVDGRLARALGVSTEHGGQLDWGADVALTPLALARLGREVGHPWLAVAAAPPVLYVQSLLRGASWRPSVGSARAVVTLAAIVAHHLAGR